MSLETPQPTTEFAGFPPTGHSDCPKCNYPLLGLPANHRCPECGFAYDEDTHLWYLGRDKSHRLLTYSVIAFNLLFAAYFAYESINGPTHIMMYVCIAVAAHSALDLRLSRRNKGFVCVGPSEIYHRSGKNPIHAYPIKKIHAMKRAKGLLGYTTLSDTEDSVTPVDFPFRSEEDRLQFIALIQKRIAEREAGGAA